MAAAGYHIKVTNKNDFPIEDRFDGIPYLIPAMGDCKIPYEAACHIFGVRFKAEPGHNLPADFREQMFRHVQRRWGWNRKEVIEKSREWFGRIETKLITLRLVEADPAEKEALPEPRSGVRGERDEGKKGEGKRQETLGLSEKGAA
jgi:hypothetical protein